MYKIASYWLMGIGGVIAASTEHVGTLIIKFFSFQDEPGRTMMKVYLAYGDYVAIAGLVLLVLGFVLYERSRSAVVDTASPWRRFGAGWFFKWSLILFALSQVVYFPIAALFTRFDAIESGIVFFQAALYLALLFLAVGLVLASTRLFGRRA